VRLRGVVTSATASWIAAALGAWLGFASCRTLLSPPAGGDVAAAPSAEPGVTPPGLRVGILVDVPRVSVATAAGVSLRLQLPGETGVELVTLPRASFVPGPQPGRLRLLETGHEFERARMQPAMEGDHLRADGTAYRGLLEVRPGTGATLTVVNLVNLEDYLRGVVPNELAPEAFPELEALKAQAVAARSYALAHLGEYASRGFDVCATPACQVYRGVASETRLTDKAVAETAGVVATWRGRPIHAYYTSTCGGHTEDGLAIFDDQAPYLRGVACPPEGSSRHSIESRLALPREVLATPGAVRDVSLLEALGVIGPAGLASARLSGIPSDTELREWTSRLLAALDKTGCESGVGGSLARRGTFAQFLVGSLCWQERAARLPAAEMAAVRQAVDGPPVEAGPERQALVLLIASGLLALQPDGSLNAGAAMTRSEVLALLAAVALQSGPPAVLEGELVSLTGGELRVLQGQQAHAHTVDERVRLIRDVGGNHSAPRELSLAIGDRVAFVLREGRVVYLEAEQERHGPAEASSHGFHWEVRLTPAQVEKAVSRYGSVGRVRDLVPRRIGVSGRVVELSVAGSSGELLLKGLKVRWGLGLRENLFVIDREIGASGIERFVITGKGWGHGVGLCQVGAFGMARAGASYEGILRHYYSGIGLARAGS
jgi:stage II sporulation protein D